MLLGTVVVERQLAPGVRFKFVASVTESCYDEVNEAIVILVSISEDLAVLISAEAKGFILRSRVLNMAKLRRIMAEKGAYTLLDPKHWNRKAVGAMISGALIEDYRTTFDSPNWVKISDQDIKHG